MRWFYYFHTFMWFSSSSNSIKLLKVMTLMELCLRPLDYYHKWHSWKINISGSSCIEWPNDQELLEFQHGCLIFWCLTPIKVWNICHSNEIHIDEMLKTLYYKILEWNFSLNYVISIHYINLSPNIYGKIYMWVRYVRNIMTDKLPCIVTKF